MNPSIPTKERTAIWLLVGLGCGLRLTGLGLHSLWFDELATVHVAIADEIVATLRADRHPPLSFLAFRGWIALSGEDDLGLRLLPALISCAALVAFVPTSRQLVGSPGARLLAIALYAVSPFLIWHGQEVRMYPFVEFGAVVAIGAATLWLDAGRARVAPAVALGVAIASGSHYLGASSVAIVTAAAACSPAAPLRRRIAVALTAALGFALWSPWLFGVLPDQLATSWGQQAHAGPRDLLELPARHVLVEMAEMPAIGKQALLLPAALVLAVVAWQFVRALRRATPACERRPSAMLAAAWLTALLPGCFGVLNFTPKYLIADSAAFVAVVAAGIVALRPRWLRVIAIAVLFAAAFAVIGLHRADNLREDHRGAIAELRAAWRVDEPIVSISGTPEGFSQAGLRHYLRGDPRMLRSILTADAVFARPAAFTADGMRLHVIFRSAPYADGSLARLREVLRCEHAGPDRFRIRYLRFADSGR